MNKLFFIFLICCNVVFSQQTTLKKALQNISKNHKIVFSYNENTILGFKSVSYIPQKKIKLSLTQLSLQTGLLFKKIDTTNYVVSKPSSQKTSICGIVMYANTNQPVSIAVVKHKEQSVFTNQKGEFKFNQVLKDGFISISAYGYKTLKILVNEFNDCNTIYLEEEINSLSEVVITNYLTKGFHKKRDGSIGVNPKKIGVLPGVIEPDVLQTLQLIPGVQSPDETASGIHIRGGTPDQNLVTFDDIKMYHFSHFFGLISAFNPYITGEVELYRSGANAKYGNSVGGVLNIVTEKNIPKKFTAGLGSTFTHSDVYLKTPFLNQKAGIVASARRSITDLVNSITFQKYSETVFQNNRISDGLSNESGRITNAENNYFYEDYYAKLYLKPDQNTILSVNYFYNANDLNFTANTINNNRSFNDDLNTTSYGFGSQAKMGSLNNKGLHKAAFYNTNYIKTYHGLTLLRSGNQSEIAFKENTLSENSFEYHFTKKINQKGQFQIGYQYNNFNVFYDYYNNSIESNPINGNTYNHAIFGEYQYSNQKLLVNTGIRWQYFKSASQAYFEPRFSLSYKINSNLNIKASSELKHQSVSEVEDFRQGALNGLFDTFWAVSNQFDLSVLESFQNTAGISYQNLGWSIDIEGYQKFVNGILFLFDELVRPGLNFSGTNTIYGVDILLKKQWKNYSSWLSYTLSKSQYQFDEFNNNQMFDGSYDMPHNLIWSHQYRYKNFETALAWRFRSGIPYTVSLLSEEGNIVVEDLNTERLPNYQRVDFSASYKFNLKKTKAKIGLTLQNVLNKQNIINREYTLDPFEGNQLIATDSYSLGFVPNMVFRLSF